MRISTIIFTILAAIFYPIISYMTPPESKPLLMNTIMLTGVIYLVSAGIGLLLGLMVANKVNVDSRGSQIFCWSILVTWLVPFVGMFMSSVVYLFHKRSDENSEYYYYLCNIGGLASMANAALGVYQSMAESGVAA